MNDVSRIDVLVAGVSVMVIVVLLTIARIMIARGLCSVVLDDFLRVDILEDTAILHGMIGSRMELT